MISNKPAFIVIEPSSNGFRALLSIEAFLCTESDPDVVLQKAADSYKDSLAKMRSLIAEVQSLRARRRLVPARKIWQLGDAIFELKAKLESLSLQLDNLYDHLVRDLGVKRKWLEKAIIFRRHLPREDLIPETLNWGRCEKGTRRAAERLRNGLPLN